MSQPSPEQIESLILRMTGKKNHAGLMAKNLKRRYGLDGFGHADIFDCDDRAELARREVEKFGYMARTRIQRSKAGRIAHRYLTVVDNDGKQHDILKMPDDY